MPANLKVIERYENYKPPVEVYRSVRLLLRYVPDQYLLGIYEVTLTDSEAVRQQIRGKISSEKRRFRPADCNGLYSKGRILLLIDQIFSNYSESCLLLPQFKTLVIGKTLYHEIGHHIHTIEKPGYRSNKEEFADEWKDRLMRAFVTQRYWYLRPLVKAYFALVRPLLLRLDRSGKAQRLDETSS